MNIGNNLDPDVISATKPSKLTFVIQNCSEHSDFQSESKAMNDYDDLTKILDLDF